MASQAANAIYTLLTSDSIVLPQNYNGAFKKLSIAQNTFKLYDGDAQADADLIAFTYTSNNAGITLTTTKSGKSILIQLTSDTELTKSFYIDFYLLYNEVTYKNRWNIDIVKDGINNNRLIYSHASYLLYYADYSYAYTSSQIERTIEDIFTQGMFRYKGDQLIFKFNYLADATDQRNSAIPTSQNTIGTNYVGVKIGSNGVYNFIMKDFMNTSQINFGHYEIRLTAVGGSAGVEYLYNQQIELRVEVYGFTSSNPNGVNVNTYRGSMIYSNSLLVNNKNLGSIQVIYSYLRKVNEPTKNIHFWGVTLEQYPNQNIL